MAEAYCVKCKKIVEVENVRIEKNKKGLQLQKGECSVCKTKTSKILGK
jgi:NAD-dependent SIR2 family protein deacetylase